MTEKQLWKSVRIALHVIAACWFWKHVNPTSADYNSLPTLAAVVFGGIVFYFLFEDMNEAPSKEEPMQPLRPWPKPIPQPPPKTDWELFVEDALGEMVFSDFYEKWKGRVPRRPKEKNNGSL